eukprot:GFUD01133841.1.p1 GENE.GFUD01133841.1~~GFUD01133841.1.p1  ORF type:complete len:110 (+),score=23.92 GFUD01133841.1:112-441(+)
MGKKSPAKIIRSAKRITYFLRNKWKANAKQSCLLSPEPVHNSLPLLENTTNHTCKDLFDMIKKYEDQRQKDREVDKLEREKRREEELEKLKHKINISFETLNIERSLPP